jgi:hypothetical protein
MMAAATLLLSFETVTAGLLVDNSLPPSLHAALGIAAKPSFPPGFRRVRILYTWRTLSTAIADPTVYGRSARPGHKSLHPPLLSSIPPPARDSRTVRGLCHHPGPQAEADGAPGGGGRGARVHVRLPRPWYGQGLKPWPARPANLVRPAPGQSPSPGCPGSGRRPHPRGRAQPARTMLPQTSGAPGHVPLPATRGARAPSPER